MIDGNELGKRLASAKEEAKKDSWRGVFRGRGGLVWEAAAAAGVVHTRATSLLI